MAVSDQGMKIFATQHIQRMDAPLATPEIHLSLVDGANQKVSAQKVMLKVPTLLDALASTGFSIKLNAQTICAQLQLQSIYAVHHASGVHSEKNALLQSI